MTNGSKREEESMSKLEWGPSVDVERLKNADPEGLYLCSLGKYPYMMSPKMIAEFLGATPQGVRKLLNAGDLKGSRCGSKWVVPQLSLLRYLYENQGGRQ